MFKLKRLQSEFKCIPPHERTSRLGGPIPPRKKENRIPEYLFPNKNEESFFVNNMNEPIEKIIINIGGSYTIDDDDVLTFTTSEFFYENILPGEAVKVEEYDPRVDSDYLLGISLTVTSSRHGEKCFNIYGKGGFRDYVLLWDNGNSR